MLVFLEPFSNQNLRPMPKLEAQMPNLDDRYDMWSQKTLCYTPPIYKQLLHSGIIETNRVCSKMSSEIISLNSCFTNSVKTFRLYPLQLLITLLTFLTNCPIAVDPTGLTLYWN